MNKSEKPENSKKSDDVNEILDDQIHSDEPSDTSSKKEEPEGEDVLEDDTEDV
jgi:hypothetical protein